MVDQNPQFRSVILAGERPGGSPLSHAFNVSASVMVPVAGKPSLERVIQAIGDSQRVGAGIICGPSADIVAESEELKNLLNQAGYEWLQPATGPAASALSALEKLNHFPALLTAGDHALLTGKIVDDFCKQVLLEDRRESSDDPRATPASSDSNYDIVIGFVPHALVKATWPESKRTVLKFSNGKFCGSNLFAILNPEGLKALSFWRQAEADRKHPWRIARRFGIFALLLYLLRRLTLEHALAALSSAAGCRIGYVEVGFARAAVDVDSIEDQKLAEKILSSPG
jgi:molybdopterin-guanine dinucleotide biosynthesis protein A